MSDFRTPAPLGRTGLQVSRLGLGSSPGPPPEVVEEAFERGINYFYWGSLRRGGFGRGMQNLARRHREKLVLTVQSYSRVAALIGPSVDVALRRSRVDYFDLLLLGMRNDAPPRAYVDAFLRLRDAGKVRFLALSTHNRPLLQSLFAQYARGESAYDVFMLRYNAVHRGAERDVFPFVPDPRPGVIAYTATRWAHLLDPAKMPPGESPPAASDCYRFALGHPAVDLVLCAPKDREQLQEGLRALERGPLPAEERERMCRIGDFIYAGSKPRFADRGDAAGAAAGPSA